MPKTVEHDDNTNSELKEIALLQAQIAAQTAAALQQLVDNAPPKQIGYGDPEYLERLKAEGYFDEFATPVIQNAHPIPARGLKPDTIERTPKLKPGSWLGGQVDVRVDSRGRVNLSYKHARQEDRMRFQTTVAPTFDILIQKLWAEMYPAEAVVTP